MLPDGPHPQAASMQIHRQETSVTGGDKADTPRRRRVGAVVGHGGVQWACYMEMDSRVPSICVSGMRLSPDYHNVSRGLETMSILPVAAKSLSDSEQNTERQEQESLPRRRVGPSDHGVQFGMMLASYSRVWRM